MKYLKLAILLLSISPIRDVSAGSGQLSTTSKVIPGFTLQSSTPFGLGYFTDTNKNKIALPAPYSINTEFNGTNPINTYVLNNTITFVTENTLLSVDSTKNTIIYVPTTANNLTSFGLVSKAAGGTFPATGILDGYLQKLDPYTAITLNLKQDKNNYVYADGVLKKYSPKHQLSAPVNLGYFTDKNKNHIALPAPYSIYTEFNGKPATTPFVLNNTIIFVTENTQLSFDTTAYTIISVSDTSNTPKTTANNLIGFGLVSKTAGSVFPATGVLNGYLQNIDPFTAVRLNLNQDKNNCVYAIVTMEKYSPPLQTSTLFSLGYFTDTNKNNIALPAPYSIYTEFNGKPATTTFVLNNTIIFVTENTKLSFDTTAYTIISVPNPTLTGFGLVSSKAGSIFPSAGILQGYLQKLDPYTAVRLHLHHDQNKYVFAVGTLEKYYSPALTAKLISLLEDIIKDDDVARLKKFISDYPFFDLNAKYNFTEHILHNSAGEIAGLTIGSVLSCGGMALMFKHGFTPDKYSTVNITLVGYIEWFMKNEEKNLLSSNCYNYLINNKLDKLDLIKK